MPATPSLHVVQAVRSDSFAGVERYICDTTTGLVALGHRVDVVGGDEERMRPLLPSGVGWTSAAGTADVARALKRTRPDVIHAHMTAAEAAAVATAPWHRAPVVATRHFAAVRGRGPTTVPARLVARRLAAEISISEFVAARTGPGSVVIHNGVPEQPRRDPAAVRPVVLMLARLEVEKDPLLGVRAFAASGLAARGWTLRIAGRGALAAEVAAAVDALGPDAGVEIIGFLDDPAAALSEAGCLLATAPEEPLGLTVLEAMSRGVPVVAAAGGAHPETVAGLGWGFPPGDVDACARALQEMAGDADEATRRGAALRERQQAEFSIAGHVDALLEVYRAAALG